MEFINLNAGNFSLALKINQHNYCSLLLIKDGHTKELGYDNIEIIIQKFLSMLDGEIFSEQDRAVKNCQYINFINLSEKHTSLYAKRISGGMEILFQNGINLETIATVFLSFQECQEWKKQLLEKYELV